jgi:hypothetical protein
MGAPSAVTHLRKIEGFRWTVPLEIVLSRVVRHQRPSINSPMLQPVLVTELVPDTLDSISLNFMTDGLRGQVLHLPLAWRQDTGSPPQSIVWNSARSS